MNDPNGLVHVEGTWHLFYQHHPASLLWGPMHWGHATSADLLRWQHHPVALEPDHLGTAFSGSAVVDTDGVAGFGRGALVAFYTHFREEQPQAQGVAASTDGGTTWRTHPDNPVLPAPAGVIDFRDPKVLRWEGPGGAHWVMVVVAGHEVVLYRSDDLLRWAECSRFGAEHGAHGGVWETPDLFELPVEGTDARRWVLTVSVIDGAPAGGSGTQYFVGSFDGETFRCDGDPGEVRWVDHGPDFYAPQSWYGAPGGRRVWVAWMSNWAYARDVPASTWRGAMTLPREVSLRRGAAGRPVLVQRPVREAAAGATVVADHTDVPVGPETPWAVEVAPAAYELAVAGPRDADARWSVEVHRGPAGATRVLVDQGAGTLVVLRDPRGLEGHGPPAAGPPVVTLRPGQARLRVVVDTGSVEVFADDGAACLTHQVFPAPEHRGLAVLAPDAAVTLAAVTVRDLTTR